MRILAIRGCNLASLAEPFEILLEAPPLGHAGLFAITGPTGSGKSTILDAMCLALFDSVPRLPGGRSGVEVGRPGDPAELRLRSNDVRTILSRDAVEGWAEVDFRGTDGRLYRSRWEVWKARRRFSGRLQDQVVTLRDLETGQMLGGTKSEVLAEIQGRLGLSFDQLRRSVLLAQGEFAAFLAARATERSELLERITGTEIYSRVSRAAHERERDERSRLDELESRLERTRPLAEEERTALELERTRAGQEVQRLDAELRALTGTVTWHEQDRRLSTAVDEATVRLEQAETAHAGAASRRQAVELVARALPVRPLVEAADAALEAHDRARLGLEQAIEQASEAAGRAERLASEHEQARDQVEAAVGALRTARPELEEARALDRELIARSREHDELAQARDQTAAEAAEAAETLAALEHQREAATQRLEQAEAWLAENAGLEPLAAQWQRWSAELERHARARAEEQQSAEALDRLRSSLEQLHERRVAVEGELTAADAGVRGATSAVELAAEQAGATPLDRLTREMRQAEARCDRLDQLERDRQQLLETADQLRQARTRADQLQQEAESAAEAAGRLDQQLSARRAALKEAERARDRALAAGSEHVRTLRARLEEDEPCPVCGATRHPWAVADPGVEQLLVELSQRVAELDAELEELTSKRAAAQTTAERATRDADEHAHRAVELEPRLEQQARAWGQAAAAEGLDVEQLEELGGDAGDGAPAELRLERATDQLAAQIHEAREALEQARQAEDHARALMSALEAARRQLETRQATLHQLQQAARDLEQEVSAIDREVAGLETRLSSARAALDQTLGSLAAACDGLDGWQNELGVDPEAFAQACARRVARWQERSSALETARASLRHLDGELRTATAEARHRAERQERSSQRLAEARRQLEEVRERRAGVLGGRPADQVETGLEQAETEARARESAVTSRLEQAREQAATTAEARRGAETGLAERAAAQVSAAARLEAALERLGLDIDELRAWLEHDEQWLETETRALTALEETLRQERAVLDERRRQESEHRAAGVPEPDLDTAVAELERLGKEQTLVREAQTGHELTLRQDDASRAQAEELTGQLAEQEARCRLWGRMKDLIGSADGSRLRSFAQGLTLDALLGNANRHLEDLARRYRLEQVHGAALELQVVDREMGEEVRSIHSLSGGETFLVSLALALGLASLSADQTQVESLFIDEGFGSLDPETLDSALASLDALQAQGRQVGVISHVPALVERIGIQVRVEPRGAGRSRVRVLDVGQS